MAPSALPDLPPRYTDVVPKVSLPFQGTASYLYDKRDLRLINVTIPPPPPGQLQIEIKATGICGSDVSYYQKRRNGDICCQPGGALCLGHESSGEVRAIGDGVTGFKPGDRVALEVGIPCGFCGICRKGRYNLCRQMKFRSSAKSNPPFQGTLQERINHPAQFCHKIPDNVSYEEAALLEPLSVAMHAANRAALKTADTALVIGAGTVGLLTALMARLAGCTQVTIMDVDQGRLDYATENGFATHGYKVTPPTCEEGPISTHTHTLSHTHGSSSSTNSSDTASDAASDTSSTFSSTSSGVSTPITTEDRDPSLLHLNPFSDIDRDFTVNSQLRIAKSLALSVLSKTQNVDLDLHDEDFGVDCTFECTGKEACMQTALYATRPGGKVIMVGMGTPIQTLPLSAAHLREVDILGIFRYCNTYAAGIKLLESGRLSQLLEKSGNLDGGLDKKGKLIGLDRMVTHRVKGLANAHEAFELAGRTKDDDGGLILKVVIEC